MFCVLNVFFHFKVLMLHLNGKVLMTGEPSYKHKHLIYYSEKREFILKCFYVECAHPGFWTTLKFLSCQTSTFVNNEFSF